MTIEAFKHDIEVDIEAIEAHTINNVHKIGVDWIGYSKASHIEKNTELFYFYTNFKFQILNVRPVIT